MFRLRSILAFLISSFVLVGFSATVFYSNFEVGNGFLKNGSYSAWPTGVYLTMPRADAISNGYKVNNLGDESVIAGVKDVSQTPPPHYLALVYRGGFSLNEASTDPLLNGVPYKGGSAPIKSNSDGSINYNGNLPAQGSFFDNVLPNPSGDDLQFLDQLKNAFVAYNSSGQPVMYTISNVDGQYYLSDGSDNLAVPITDLESIPVYYKNDNGDMVQGYYNSVTGGFSQSTGSGSGDGNVDMSPVIDSVASAANSIVNANNSNHQSLRALLVSQLGEAGHSWVYDSKLSLDSLVQFANDTGVKIRFPSNFDLTMSSIDSNIASLNQKDFSPTVNVAAPVVNVNPPEVNVAAPNVTVNPAEVNIDLSGVRSDLSTIKSSQSTGLTRLSTIHNDLYNYLRPNLVTTREILESWNTGNELSNLPQPDFGDDSPDDDLPSYVVSAWQNELSDSNMSQVFGDMVSWGDNGSPTQIVPDFLSSFLTSWVGAIPSVGSDAHMFDVNFELPYIGLITKSFSWADYPYVSDFRAFLVWVLYLFFGLACFKLLHKTFI